MAARTGLRIVWTDEHVGFVKKNFGIITDEQIAQSLGRSAESIKQKALRLGLRDELAWNEIDTEYLKEHFATTLNKDLAKHFGKSVGCIEQKGRNTGLSKHPDHVDKVRKELGVVMQQTNRKYELNQNYFTSINDPDKAYWFGFIWADGCVIKTDDSHRLSLLLATRDESHIDKFKAEINTNAPTVRGQYFTDQGTVIYRSIVNVNCVVMVNDLIGHGMIPAKSKQDCMPTLPSDEFMRDFIRGIFDGDGSVSGKNKMYTKVSIVGSKSCMNCIRDYLSERLDVGGCTFSSKKGTFYTWNMSGAKQVQKFFDYIYHENCTKLDRKFLKFTQLGYNK